MKKLTKKEFHALPRDEDGDITNLGEVFLFIKDDHVALLSDNDWSRYHQMQEDLAYDIQSLREEFA